MSKAWAGGMSSWRCPACGDVMPTKYQRTHPMLCAVASVLIAPQVEQLIDRLSDEEPRG